MTKTIASCAVHPAIGVARVGNSRTGWYVGPELPGLPVHPPGGFKVGHDGDEIKRQAVRFRVFAFADDGSLIGELSAADADITWQLELANRKAEWDEFDATRGEDLPLAQRQPSTEWRNHDVVGAARAGLVITPAAATLRAGERHVFDDGRFMGVPVTLGEARVEPSGHLLVFGGFGRSETVDEGRRIVDYANNDRWFDDIADGPVRAEVKLADGRVLQAKPAWVLSAPPDFSPETVAPVTLYDVVVDTAIRHLGVKPPARPAFTQHVLPTIRRAEAAGWTHRGALLGHRRWTAHLDLATLADPGEAARPQRQALFASLRNPFAEGDAASAQANARFMPALSGDKGERKDGDALTWLTLTRTQYTLLKQWAEGDFDADGTAPPPPSSTVSPAGLDRAALEACTGGPLCPGIEGGWIFRMPEAFAEPGRFDAAKLRAGDVTKRMSVPWQADFFECHTSWWPSQRPDDVLPAAAFERLCAIDRLLANPDLGHDGSDQAVREALQAERTTLLMRRLPWTRLLPKDDLHGDNAMVRQWSELGFVTSQLPDGSAARVEGRRVLVESEASALAQLDRGNFAEVFHRLINIERLPDFRKTARGLATWFLAQADTSDPHHQPFDYSVAALRQRLDAIYGDLAARSDAPHWLEDFPKAAVLESLRQRAPMNLIDGSWLDRIMAAGPAGAVRAKLFEIWTDEAGDGQPGRQHANLYDALLRSQGIVLPPVSSRAFADLDLLPSAWTAPAFQLCMGLFPQDLLPELLGMTLYLEWEATPTLLPAVRMLRKFDIDPSFYALHAAVDNIAAGHGALARQAVELHLDEVGQRSGAAAMQAEWKRVWNGYVTWATLGSFGRDLFERLTAQYQPGTGGARLRMLALVRRKVPVARTAHGDARVGGKLLASLFDTPDALLDALVADGWVDPQQPRQSRFFTQLLAEHGPMFKVFTPAEQDVILGWIESLAIGAGDPAQRLQRLLDVLKGPASHAPAHQKARLKLADGRQITVAQLFASGDTRTIMAGLAGCDLVVKGQGAASPLIAKIFGQVMKGVLSAEQIATFVTWIDAACPLPAGAAAAGTDTPSAAADADSSFARRRPFIGAGSVH